MPNPGNEIKPEMYANVDLHVSGRERLVVPVNAVLNSGLRQTVFVDRGNGFLEPRQVETGERMGDRVEILRGLTAGEHVATSGVFLIDSESQLKSAASATGAHPHGSAPAAGAGNGGLEPAAPAASRESAPAQPPAAAGTHQHD
jgi:Cu(I)/Ag(I) efflux system membrane fusion protein